MKLEVIKQHMEWVPGERIDVGKGVADVLLSRGIAKVCGGCKPCKRRGRPRKDK